MSSEREPDFGPDEAMRVLEAQLEKTRRQLGYPDHLVYPIWGVAYLVGYLPLALSRGPDPVMEIPLGLALGWFFAFLIAGIVPSMIIASRFCRGLRGRTSRQGMLYGFSWMLAFPALFALSYRLGASADFAVDDDYGILINGVAMLLVGTLMVAGGVAWLDIPQFVIGAGTCLVTTLALFLGLPAYYWIMSLVVGGGFLLLGIGIALRRRTAGSGEGG